ncbi:hypothetical protein [Chryseobacterium sp. FH2]|uniref:hypothetical protein n=1 Tax=Chryseobacterium sp. FH2 TaxID=1674291 RepID=UPI000B273ABE|nr:hypothetical protein [Chryseobacterium sp. FH2]
MDIVKNKLYAEGVLGKNNEQDLSTILAEKYIKDGIDVELYRQDIINKLENLK